jgi:NAD(P)-dependent dehydrogenase (short-subunit alcohol dehydrogenase family)
LAALGPQASSFTLKAVDSWRVYGRAGNSLWGYARLRHSTEQVQGHDAADDVQGDIRLFDERGQIVAEAIGVRWQPATQALLERLHLQQVRRWLYEVTWQPRLRERTSSTAPHPAQPGSWLIFTDGEGVGEGVGAELATLLTSRGDTPVLVLPGGAYGRLTDHTFSVDVAQPGDFRRVFEEVLTPDMPPCRGVIHLWSLNDQHAGEQSLSALQETQALACGSVLSLVQALTSCQVATGKTASPRLWLVTRAAQDVSGQSSELAPAQASLWGLGRVIAHEHPEIWGGLIDLDAASTEVSSWVSALWESDHEDQIAIRSGQRYVARLTRQQTTLAQHAPLTLHADGTYLITGGLGGLGLQVAQWLAQQGARHIALMGRSGANSQAAEPLQALERCGARVVVLRGDVSRAEDVERALADIRRDMPPLRGVIHAAGVLDDGTLLRLDWEAFARVLAPKVQGAWNLHTATRDVPLDMFILFSSVMALLGTPGQGNYAAANAFLDTLAHYRRRQGLAALSVNWGVWANVGLAARADRADRLIQQGFGALTPEQALTALDDLMRQHVPQAAVLPIQWANYAQHLPQAANAPFLSALAEEMQGQAGQSAPASMQAQAPLLQQLADAAPAARYDLLMAFVRAQVAAVMHFDATTRLDPQQGFFSPAWIR